MGYNDGTCSELVIFSTFMLELGDYSVPTALTGEEEDYYYIIMNLIWELPMRGRSSEYLIRNPLPICAGDFIFLFISVEKTPTSASGE